MNASVCCQEDRHSLHVVVGCGEYETCAAIVVTCLQRGSVPQEHLHDRGLDVINGGVLPGAGALARMVQCALLRVIQGVDVHILLREEVLHEVFVAEGCGIDESSLAADVAGVQVQAAREARHEAPTGLHHFLQCRQVASARGLQQFLHAVPTDCAFVSLTVLLEFADQELSGLCGGADPSLALVTGDFRPPVVLLADLQDLHNCARLQVDNYFGLEVLLLSYRGVGLHFMLSTHLELCNPETILTSLLHKGLIQLRLRTDPTTAG
mmetsp:Transcript_65954/g.143050  ORF Transcript_65954/g.143050 Transcript_65954/m.143050 type:complete len:266 (+) Transcript_65954:91-888(+)